MTIVAHVVPLLKRLTVADNLTDASQKNVDKFPIDNVKGSVVALLSWLWPLVEDADRCINLVFMPYWSA